MKAKIAVATVSGIAYYKLVNELKRRGIPFLSLKPSDPIPLDIKVVITTEEESSLIKHQEVLTLNEHTNPAALVNEALRRIQGRRNPERVVIGIDPGKTSGLAVLEDGFVLETAVCYTIEDVINKISEVLMFKPKFSRVIVKIGNGAPFYTKKLSNMLDKMLPREVEIEIVEEAGTSRFFKEEKYRKRERDVVSAIRIAERRGKQLMRGGEN